MDSSEIFLRMLYPEYSPDYEDEIQAVLFALLNMSDSMLKYFEGTVDKVPGAQDEAINQIIKHSRGRLSRQDVEDVLMMVYNEFCDFGQLCHHAINYKQELSLQGVDTNKGAPKLH